MVRQIDTQSDWGEGNELCPGMISDFISYMGCGAY